MKTEGEPSSNTPLRSRDYLRVCDYGHAPLEISIVFREKKLDLIAEISLQIIFVSLSSAIPPGEDEVSPDAAPEDISPTKS
jgi:hypothetical protein